MTDARPGSAISADIVVDDERWTEIAALEAMVDRALGASIAQGVIEPPARVGTCVLLTSDRRMQELNSSWRGVDKPTNVLAFPMVEGGAVESHRFLGDIALGYETVLREAGERGIPVENHLAHLVVHGFLHLAGFDHEDDAMADEMESVESRILVSLGIPDPNA